MLGCSGSEQREGAGEAGEGEGRSGEDGLGGGKGSGDSPGRGVKRRIALAGWPGHSGEDGVGRGKQGGARGEFAPAPQAALEKKGATKEEVAPCGRAYLPARN